ncbi:hypothetical protein SBOR_9346 [Sclerotinia borealis F-4128]|uniref:Protein kinase domain-containing protein n=1 Tax=Sclerotinia borealis (strain F-4128) TaxID=1432307 RepID=W9C0D0_SCLBF|nr:hypothetical protein SBOR_9346 [Sclerotinia borealis F-4128]
MASRRKPPGRPPPGRRPPPAVNRISSLAKQLGSTNLAPNISYTPIFSTAPPRTPPPGQPSPSDWESYIPSQREQKQAEAWRKLSETWEQWPGFDRSWEGVRHLGKGGAGSAELFRKIGSAEGTQGMPEYIVVKQPERSDKDLLNESIFLQLLMDRNTPHVLKIYRGYHEGEAVPRHVGGMFDIGRENFQKRRKMVASRIYLEFCEKGDAEKWTMDHVEPVSYLKKESSGVTEAIEIDKPIIKRSTSMLIHPNTFPISSSPNLSKEQFFPQMEDRSYSTPANVFGIAAIVYYVMTKQRIEIGQGMAYVGFPSLDSDPSITPKPPVLTCGRSLLDNPIINNSGIYSKTLIRTLLQCLAYSPNKRMTAKQLLDVCTKGRFLFDSVLEKYIYESSQPTTNYWPDRAAAPKGISGYEDIKDFLNYYPTNESIAAAKEREERFLASFWVTPPKQVAPPVLAFTNPFNSGTGLDSSSGVAFSFGDPSSNSQFGNSNPKFGDDHSGGPSSGSGFMFGQ